MKCNQELEAEIVTQLQMEKKLWDKLVNVYETKRWENSTKNDGEWKYV